MSKQLKSKFQVIISKSTLILALVLFEKNIDKWEKQVGKFSKKQKSDKRELHYKYFQGIRELSDLIYKIEKLSKLKKGNDIKIELILCE